VKKTQKCKDGEEINPETGRCRKVCPPGTIRNENGKCVKSANKTKKVNKCKDDEEINPETGRCRKKCPEGKVRNEKGNCVNAKK
jgi:Fe-S-cluster-containing hydrogenase component 2